MIMSDSDTDATIDSDELDAIIAASKEEKKGDSHKRKNQKKPGVSRKTSLLKESRKLHELSSSGSEGECDGDAELFGDDNVPTSVNLDKNDVRPPCKYGDKCYRKNPEHFRMFSHSKRGGGEDSHTHPSEVKRQKIVVSDKQSSSLQQNNNTFGFFMTRVCGISRKFNDSISLDIKDLLSASQGKLKASAQFNYMFDIPWLIEQYPTEFRNCPLTVVHGEQREAKRALEKSGAPFSNVKFCQAKLEIPFGTHHTKMMLLLYEDGLRVIIHTSNLVEGDWLQKTQGMWVSPKFPLLKGAPSISDGDSPTRFKADLLEYISSYNAKDLEEWCLYIKQHDLSKARVFLIGSVPGRHVGTRKTAFGHLKLRKVLTNNGPTKDTVTADWPVIAQFSSIGSLGSSPEQWMRGEWLMSLATIKGTTLPQLPSLKLVYPSVENVRTSLEGYPAGASLPYSIKVATKQPYLKDFMHQWKSDWIGRSEASPHIKTYLRLSPDNKRIAWFLVTSANLSKAAWGSLEKKGSQLMIRSYELGVLFIPQFFSEQQLFSVPCSGLEKKYIPFPVPYDIPLSRYRNKEEPWIWDIPHVYAPDRNGNKWCPS